MTNTVKCPCGKPLIHTDDPEDACLIPLARLQESNPSRWGTKAPTAASKRCQSCKRDLHPGESAWASDWRVVTPTGLRLEVRYDCDDCEVA